MINSIVTDFSVLNNKYINAKIIITGFCQQQYFRIQPKDVKVHEGGEVILQCEVAHLGGMVQWTKDGFALGEFYYFFYSLTFFFNL